MTLSGGSHIYKPRSQKMRAPRSFVILGLALRLPGILLKGPTIRGNGGCWKRAMAVWTSKFPPKWGGGAFGAISNLQRCSLRWYGCVFCLKVACLVLARHANRKPITSGASLLWMDKFQFAPPKKPWNDDSTVNTNQPGTPYGCCFFCHTPLTEENKSGHTDLFNGLFATTCRTNMGFIRVICATDRKTAWPYSQPFSLSDVSVHRNLLRLVVGQSYSVAYPAGSSFLSWFWLV